MRVLHPAGARGCGVVQGLLSLVFNVLFQQQTTMIYIYFKIQADTGKRLYLCRYFQD